MAIDDKIKPGKRYTLEEFHDLGLVQEPDVSKFVHKDNWIYNSVFRDHKNYYFCDKRKDYFIPIHIMPYGIQGDPDEHNIL